MITLELKGNHKKIGNIFGREAIDMKVLVNNIRRAENREMKVREKRKLLC